MAYNRCKDCNNVLCDKCYESHYHGLSMEDVVKKINSVLKNEHLSDRQKLVMIMELVKQ